MQTTYSGGLGSCRVFFGVFFTKGVDAWGQIGDIPPGDDTGPVSTGPALSGKVGF